MSGSGRAQWSGPVVASLSQSYCFGGEFDMAAKTQRTRTGLSTSDFEYLENVKQKLQKWKEDKKILEDAIRSLENELEYKDKALFASCKGFHDLEMKQWEVHDNLESKRAQLEYTKKAVSK